MWEHFYFKIKVNGTNKGSLRAVLAIETNCAPPQQQIIVGEYSLCY